MAEDRLERIENRLDKVENRLDRVENRLDRVENRLGRVEGRLEGVEHRLVRLGAGQAKLEVGQTKLEAGYANLEVKLEAGLGELGRQMLVLHEEVIDRIKAIGDPSASLRREFRAGDEALREEIARRLDPLELTVRDHSADLERLKRRRDES